jgi:hypothetical protein
MPTFRVGLSALSATLAISSSLLSRSGIVSYAPMNVKYPGFDNPLKGIGSAVTSPARSAPCQKPSMIAGASPFLTCGDASETPYFDMHLNFLIQKRNNAIKDWNGVSSWFGDLQVRVT